MLNFNNNSCIWIILILFLCQGSEDGCGCCNDNNGMLWILILFIFLFQGGSCGICEAN